MSYYILEGEDTKGPFTIGQLRSMWSTGSITSKTLHCQEGDAEWRPLSSIHHLIEPSAVPPPLSATQPHAKTTGSSRFKNPANGYIEDASSPWLPVLLLGCIYFAVKGVWTHAVAGFILAWFTCGLSWLIYPLFAKEIMRSHYLRKGWVEL